MWVNKTEPDVIKSIGELMAEEKAKKEQKKKAKEQKKQMQIKKPAP